MLLAVGVWTPGVRELDMWLSLQGRLNPMAQTLQPTPFPVGGLRPTSQGLVLGIE